MRRSRITSRGLVALIGLAALAGLHCNPTREQAAPERSAAPPRAPAPDPLAPLHAYEEGRRAAADFAALPSSDHALGPDPYALALLEGKGRARFAGLLRGRDAIVLLDEALQEIARAPAPPSPTGLAVAHDGEIFVCGDQSPNIARYRLDHDTLKQVANIPLDGARAIRDLALSADQRTLYAVDEHEGRLFVIARDGAKAARSLPTCDGPIHVSATKHWTLVDCLLSRSVLALPLDPHGEPDPQAAITLHHDGPIWGVSTIEEGKDLFLLAGGVEDHPLDRSDGAFGNIDSFVYLYRVPFAGKNAERLTAVNTSAEGLVTPKAISLEARGKDLFAIVTGYGSDRLLTLEWQNGRFATPTVRARPFLPGVSNLAHAPGAGLVFANPLFDAWLRLDDPSETTAPPAPIPVPDAASPPRDPESRLGEALVFTTLMAPWNRSEGRESRFTCETCHFEGYVDGRTHHTGRGQVHATTKPLLGLFNNRPHFSRALDPDLSTVSNNEFRVANKKGDHDPWFTLNEREIPWLSLLGPVARDPLSLRRAFMAFLMDFTPRPNPAVQGRSAWTPDERRGAQLFARRCEPCHQARLASDLPATRLPFERWEAMVMRRDGPVVWACSEYEKTGVVPYVHDAGARVPSLRRLYKKRPYFTNGSAKDLGAVLERARLREGRPPDEEGAFFHDTAPSDAVALDADERAALASFLDLL